MLCLSGYAYKSDTRQDCLLEVKTLSRCITADISEGLICTAGGGGSHDKGEGRSASRERGSASMGEGGLHLGDLHPGGVCLHPGGGCLHPGGGGLHPGWEGVCIQGGRGSASRVGGGLHPGRSVSGSLGRPPTGTRKTVGMHLTGMLSC